MKKLTLLAAIGVGYVLGARAGRERYEQIRDKAQATWEDPRVQQRASAAQDLVAQKAPLVAEKAQQVAADLTGKMAGPLSGADDPDSSRSSGSAELAEPVESDAAGGRRAPAGRLP